MLRGEDRRHGNSESSLVLCIWVCSQTIRDVSRYVSRGMNPLLRRELHCVASPIELRQLRMVSVLPPREKRKGEREAKRESKRLDSVWATDQSVNFVRTSSRTRRSRGSVAVFSFPPA
jgi:hypothetical protein